MSNCKDRVCKVGKMIWDDVKHIMDAELYNVVTINIDYGSTKEEAFLTAAMDNKTSYLFDWYDEEGIWSEPDGNISHCTSDTYPLGKWFEVEHLSTDLTEPQIIIEDHYSE